MQRARQNFIMSNGLRHGAGGSFRAGDEVPSDLAAVAPKGLVSEPEASAAAQEPPATPDVAGEPAGLPGAKAPSPPRAVLSIPTRKELFLMRKSDMQALAAELSIEFAEDAKADDIRDRLAKQLGL